ncbi:MAG: hypothetical protein QOI38_2019 [Sphingomonadales bacterium]|jgi:hypothetical protein|nr:hypothetical protein [Sphingomonadales bacterium]
MRRRISSSPSPKVMGRGTTRRVVEGHCLDLASYPTTMLRMVPLPTSFARREEP